MTLLAESSEPEVISRLENRSNRKEAIERAWDQLSAESLGVEELGLIQIAIEREFGQASLESPAEIARTLADIGVSLRHPEVLNADLKWRQSQVEVLFDSNEVDFSSMDSAISSLNRIESKRASFLRLGNEDRMEDLQEFIREIKSDLSVRETELAREVVQWLTIWLQNPEIFADWLALRQKSPDFVRRFK